MPNPPDEKWLPFLKLLFGIMLLVMLSTLAAIIAIGHVHQDTSFGLTYILGALSTLSGGFAQWAFSQQPNQVKG